MKKKLIFPTNINEVSNRIHNNKADQPVVDLEIFKIARNLLKRYNHAFAELAKK